MEKILVIIDGGADLPVKEFNGKTPFEAARTTNLDFFAKNGKLGYMYPINEKIVPGSDNALISIFGNDPSCRKRGIFEAIGAGFKLKRGDLALRANFGTIENLETKKVIDRRAGRNLTLKETELLAKTLNGKIKLPCKFEFKTTVQHRGVLVLRGGFSENISNIDPEYDESGNKSEIFKFSEPLDDEENSDYTSDIINNFVDQAFKILETHPVNIERKRKGFFPANMVFLRGGGVEIPLLKQYKTWMSINSMPLEIGIASLSGMKNFSFQYPELRGNKMIYETLFEGLSKSINFAIKTIKKENKYYNGCYVQLKEADVPGHDGKPFEKKKMLEIIDKKFFGFLRKFAKKKEFKIVVTCDHSTPCKLKMHSSDFVPVLVYDGEGKDGARFSEKDSKKGSLGKIYGEEFFEKTGLNR